MDTVFRYILHDWVLELPRSFSPRKLGHIRLLLNTEWFSHCEGSIMEI